MRAQLLFVGAVLLGACVYRPPYDPTDPADPADPTDPTEDPPAAVDTDGDGIPDADDNCPLVANANQADEDNDLVGNACDNCPHIANTDQANVMETQNGELADAVGDVCDPDPTHAGNSIRLFLGFDDASEIADWSFAGSNSRTVTGGSLVIDGTDLALLFKNGLNTQGSFMTTSVHYNSIQATQFRGAALVTRWNRNSGGEVGTGVGCGEMRDSLANGNNPFRDIVLFQGPNFQHNIRTGTATVDVNHDAIYSAQFNTGSDSIACSNGSTTFSGSVTGLTGTGISFAVWGATVEFRYLVVID